MRYDNTNIAKNEDGIKYYSTTMYPLINPKDTDIYVITVQGDRLDLLAYQYYNDSNLWWIISAVNSVKKGSIFITPGTQLRIPTDINSFLAEFNYINKNK